MKLNACEEMILTVGALILCYIFVFNNCLGSAATQEDVGQTAKFSVIHPLIFSSLIPDQSSINCLEFLLDSAVKYKWNNFSELHNNYFVLEVF